MHAAMKMVMKTPCPLSTSVFNTFVYISFRLSAQNKITEGVCFSKAMSLAAHYHAWKPLHYETVKYLILGVD